MLNRIILWLMNDLLGEKDWDFDCIDWSGFWPNQTRNLIELANELDEYEELDGDE